MGCLKGYLLTRDSSDWRSGRVSSQRLRGWRVVTSPATQKHEIKNGSTHISHVILLTCYWGLLNFPDRTGWGVSRHYLPTRSPSEWGWVGLLSGSVAGEVLPIRPDSKDPKGFNRLPAAYNRGSDLNREPQPSLDTITGFHDLWGHSRASVDIRSKYSEKHSVTLVKNEDFLRGCGPCFFASCFEEGGSAFNKLSSNITLH